MGRPRAIALWASLLICLLATSSAQASRIRSLNLEQMAQRADRILSGRCVGVRVTRDDEIGQTVTYVTLAVQRSVKGDAHGTVTIKLLGDQDADIEPGRSTEGIPRFSRGEDVVLFLYGDSRRGLTSPVGFGQGKFSVRKDKNGREFAINGFANDGLFRGLTPQGEGRLARPVAELKRRATIPTEDLLDIAQRLAAPPESPPGRGRP